MKAWMKMIPEVGGGGILVEAEVELVVDGTLQTLSPLDANRLLSSIRLTQKPHVNGKVKLTVVAETSLSSAAS